jgi:16S rRNA (adenine1518-N6/adenine1519-N6)-dimethyltransferase
VNVVPKKQLGQHFLVDDNIIGVIARLAELAPADVVLEVGPGPGTLTRYLSGRVAHVHAVEIDRSFAARLDGIPRTTVHWGDALEVDVSKFDPPVAKLVANLPYNVATPLLVESLDRLPGIRQWCVMVQREVADRLFAGPRSKAYGAVSVLVQLATERTGFHAVSREVFRPRPNVASALVAFRRTAPGIDPTVKRLVGAAFAHRRKTIANSLDLAGYGSREGASAALESIGRDPRARAEELSPAEFVELAAALR